MVKRSPLNRGKPLERKAPAKPKEIPLSTTRSVKKEGRTNPRPRRDTGPTADTRMLVITRAMGHCERCGKTLQGVPGNYSIHHRRPRGMGGTRDEKANQASNLVLLCGSATTPEGCHTTVERFRASAVTTGYIVPQSKDPETVPIKLSGPLGKSSGWFILRPDGLKVPTLRPEAEDE